MSAVGRVRNLDLSGSTSGRGQRVKSIRVLSLSDLNADDSDDSGVSMQLFSCPPPLIDALVLGM